MDRERRMIPMGEGVEVRLVDQEEGSVLEYTAPPFETWSRDLGGFVEKFERGAFVNLEDADGEGDILSTFQHSNSKLLGRTRSGTLTLAENDGGLLSRVSLPETATGEEVRELVKRGDVRGASFEFMLTSPDGERWEKGVGGRMERTVLKGGAVLFQTGPVVNPAYGDDTKVALRSLEAAQEATEGEEDPEGPGGELEPEGTQEGRKRTLEELERFQRNLELDCDL